LPGAGRAGGGASFLFSGGPGGAGGNISIEPPQFIILDNSLISANAARARELLDRSFNLRQTHLVILIV
jgi:uncharacterized spore protein YtfJ